MNRAIAGLILALIASVSPALAQRAQNPQNSAVVCAYNTSPPTLTSGWFAYAQCDSTGKLIVSGAGGGGGTSSTFGATFPTTGTAIGQSDGTNMQPFLGNTNGTYVQGSIPSGSSDSGNSIKIGAIFNTTAPTVTTGQRVDLQANNRGSLNTIISSGATIVGLATPSDGASQVGLGTFSQTMIFNGSNWDRAYSCNSTATVSVTAGSTTEIVPLTASQIIRVCSFTISMSIAGSAQFAYGTGTNCAVGTTNLTGAVSLATATPWAMSAGGPGANLFRTASANALCVIAATGTAVGFVTYAKY